MGYLTSNRSALGGAAKSFEVSCDCEETKPENSRCFKPSKDWLSLFPTGARSAFKPCKCLKDDAFEVVVNYKALQDQGANCYMYCPCLCSDFCENSSTFSDEIWCGDATDGIFCPNDDKAPAFGASTELLSTKSMYGKAETTENFKYIDASTLKEGPRTASTSAEQSALTSATAGSFAKTSLSVPTTTEFSASSAGSVITTNRKADNVESADQIASSSTPLLPSTTSLSLPTHYSGRPSSEDRTTTSPTFAVSRLGEVSESSAEREEPYSTSSGTDTFPLRSETMNSGEGTSSTSHLSVPHAVEDSESVAANAIPTTEKTSEKLDVTPQTQPASPSMTKFPESSRTKTQAKTRKVLSTSSNALTKTGSSTPIDLPETEATDRASKGESSEQPSPPSSPASSRAQPTYVNLDSSRITTMSRESSTSSLSTEQQPTELLHSDDLKPSNAPEAEQSFKYSSRRPTVASSEGQTSGVHSAPAMTTTVRIEGITIKKEPTELLSSAELRTFYDLKTTSSGTVSNEPEETDIPTTAAKDQSDISEDVPTRLIPVSEEADYLNRLSTGSFLFNSFGHYSSVEEKPITWPILEPFLFNTTAASRNLGNVMTTTSVPDINDHSPKSRETSTADQYHPTAISSETTEQTEPFTTLSTTDPATGMISIVPFATVDFRAAEQSLFFYFFIFFIVHHNA